MGLHKKKETSKKLKSSGTKGRIEDLEFSIKEMDERILRNEEELNKIKVFDNTKIRQQYRDCQNKLRSITNPISSKKHKKKRKFGMHDDSTRTMISTKVDKLINPCVNYLLDTVAEHDSTEAGFVDEFVFEVSFCENLKDFTFEDAENKVMFKVDSENATFEDYLPRIAHFFLKDTDKVFLLSPEGHVLLKEYKVWETLLPFRNSKLKGTIPECKLINIGGWPETQHFLEEEKFADQMRAQEEKEQREELRRLRREEREVKRK